MYMPDLGYLQWRTRMLTLVCHTISLCGVRLPERGGYLAALDRSQRAISGARMRTNRSPEISTETARPTSRYIVHRPATGGSPDRAMDRQPRQVSARAPTFQLRPTTTATGKQTFACGGLQPTFGT